MSRYGVVKWLAAFLLFILQMMLSGVTGPNGLIFSIYPKNLPALLPDSYVVPANARTAHLSVQASRSVDPERGPKGG